MKRNNGNKDAEVQMSSDIRNGFAYNNEDAKASQDIENLLLAHGTFYNTNNSPDDK